MRRQRQAEAALKRQQEVSHSLYSSTLSPSVNALSLLSRLSQAEARGLKNPEAVKAKQKRREEAERQAKAASGAGGGGEPAMKVSYPL